MGYVVSANALITLKTVNVLFDDAYRSYLPIWVVVGSWKITNTRRWCVEVWTVILCTHCTALPFTLLSLLMTGTSKFDHITLVLCQIHWLPVRQWITDKLAMITFKRPHGLLPSYLADACIPISSAGGSCSRLPAGHSSCHVPGLWSVSETLLCRARPHGTASPSNCGLHHCLPAHCKSTQKWFLQLLAPIKTMRFDNDDHKPWRPQTCFLKDGMTVNLAIS